MQCDICNRSVSSRLLFNCTLCARDALYQPRIQLAQTQLHAESLGKEVEQNLVGISKKEKARSSAGAKGSDLNHTWTVQRAASDQLILEEKTQTVLSHVEALREETQKIRADIASRKSRLLRRRADFASAKQELSQSQASAVEAVDKSIKRTEHRWDVMHNKTAESRLFLCREVALLYGLHQRKRKKGGLGRDVYFIGGVPIADLKELNSTDVLHGPSQHTKSLQMQLQLMLRPLPRTSPTSPNWSHITSLFASLPKLPFLTAIIPFQQSFHLALPIRLVKYRSRALTRITPHATALQPPAIQITNHYQDLGRCTSIRSCLCSPKRIK